MSMQLPPELMAAISGGGGGGAPDQGGQPDQESPLDTLQEVIQMIPGLLHALPDPQDVQDASRALLILAGIQTRLMRANGSPGQAGG